jgi:hypothetical protein
MTDPLKLTWDSKGLEHEIFDMSLIPTAVKFTIGGVEYTVTDDLVEEIWNEVTDIKLTGLENALMALITKIVVKYS